MRCLVACLGIYFSLSICSEAQIIINEIQSSNINTIIDEFSEYPDWIELYNSTDSPVDISGWYLSDDKQVLNKWPIPSFTMNPENYLLVFASGKDIGQLPVKWSTIIEIGDSFDYWIPDQQIDDNWKLSGFVDPEWQRGISGFGYGDGDDSTEISNPLSSLYLRRDFLIEDTSKIKQMVLHVDYDDGFIAYLNGIEVTRGNMGAAHSVVTYDQYTENEHEALMYKGGFPESFDISEYLSVLINDTNTLAIEVHNASSTSTDMTIIPFLSLGKTIYDSVQEGPSDYLQLNEGNPHTNFKIKSEGESIYLSDSEGNIIDSLAAVYIPSDYSYGKIYNTNSDYNYFLNPTPGNENDSIGYSILTNDNVIFSRNGGYFNGSLVLSLNSPSGESIYYTLDGTEPDTSSAIFSENIIISENKVVKAAVIRSGFLPGKVFAKTYFNDHQPDIPVLCISTEPDNLWDYNTGIYVMGPNAEPSVPHFGANFWMDWEKPVFIELYNTNGYTVVSQAGGTKIYGKWSRARAQKSLAFFARKSYGNADFEANIFPKRSISDYKSFVARNAGNDCDIAFIRDAFMTDLTSHLGLDYQSFQPVATFLNGEYWGIYNLREKINEDFLASHHQINADNINLLEGDAEILEGDNTSYLELTSFLQSKSSLANPEDYTYVNSKIDIDNYIKYQLVQIYVDNTDWPGNNMKFWNSNLPGSKYRWILYDTDFGFGEYSSTSYSNNTLDFALEPYGPEWPNPPWSTLLLRKLVTNTYFRNNFINQFADHINTTFLTTAVNRKVDSIKKLYISEMVHHKVRWGGSYDSWSYEVERLKTWGQARPSYMRNHIRSTFNLSAQYNITLTVSNKLHGTIKLNSIHPVKYPFTGIYFKDVPIKMEAVPEVGYTFVRWEGEVNSADRILWYDPQKAASFKAVFEPVSVEDIQIVINEINYNSGPEYLTSDWVEFYNRGNSTVDLSGYLFSDSNPDSGFVFPLGTIMYPEDYLIVAKSIKKFSEVHPDVSPVLGNIIFGLSSSGDELRLYDTDGNVIDAVDYQVYSPWPEAANGLGPTLELKMPDLDNGQPENWKADFNGGTPGKANHGFVGIEKAEQPVLSSLSVFPSHFSDYATIEFSLEKSSDVELQLIDIQGRTIKTLRLGHFSPGSYSNNIYPDDIRLNSGVYLIKLTTNHDQLVKKIIYTR
jgi:hypothetical protein